MSCDLQIAFLSQLSILKLNLSAFLLIFTQGSGQCINPVTTDDECTRHATLTAHVISWRNPF